MQRELSLIVHESDVQVKSISVDKYALHVKEFDSRIVRFWWGYRKLDVCEGIALLLPNTIINIAKKWLDASDNANKIYSLSLPYNTTGGLIRWAKGALWVAVTVQGNITVYTQELVQAYYFPRSPLYDPYSVLLVPSAQGLLFALPTLWLAYDFGTDLVKQQSAPSLYTITHAAVLTVPCETQEKYYIITLGFKGTTKLYADLKLLDREAKSFRIINTILITMSDLYKCTLYIADINSIRKHYSFETSINLNPEIHNFDSFEATASYLIVTQRCDDYRKMSFLSYDGKLLRTITLNGRLDQLFVLKSKSEVYITTWIKTFLSYCNEWRDCLFGTTIKVLEKPKQPKTSIRKPTCKPWRIGRKH